MVKFRKHRAFLTTDPGLHLKPIESASPGWLPGNVEFGNHPPVILEHRLLGVPAWLPASLSPACKRKPVPVPQSQNLHFSPKASGLTSTNCPLSHYREKVAALDYLHLKMCSLHDQLSNLPLEGSTGTMGGGSGGGTPPKRGGSTPEQ